MSVYHTLTSQELSSLNKIFIKRTKITDTDFCFCGSGEYFQSCCYLTPNLWVGNDFKDSLLGFIKSKNWKVDADSISFIFPKFAKLYQENLDFCARPSCNNKVTINSHVYGKKHIQKYLNGKKCKIHNPYITDGDFFNELHTGNEISYRIFCGNCDSKLFKNIDDPEQEVNDEKNQFLHFLRTQAYQYQFVRQDLSLSHQFILGTIPVIELERQKEMKKENTSIDLTWFIQNNNRYQYQARLRKTLWNIFESNEHSSRIPFLTTRTLASTQPLFASGIFNPTHDLSSMDIKFKKDSAVFYYIIPDKEKNLVVTIASFDNEYANLIKQFNNSPEYKFKKYMNHVISHCSLPLNLVLPDSFRITGAMIAKLKKKKAYMAKYLNKKPSDIDSRKIYAKLLD